MAQLKDLLVNGKSKFLDIITATGIRLASGGSSSVVWNTNGGTVDLSSGLSGDYLRRYQWWASGESHNVDNLMDGITFAYAAHGAATAGTIVSFNCSNQTTYPFQMLGDYNNNELYFRNRNGDQGLWGNWHKIWNSNSNNELTANHHISIDTTSGGNTSNYISAGGGYSYNSGKYGVKVLACDQSDYQTGLGQDLSNVTGGYDFCLVGGNNTSDVGHISFVTHKVNSTTYRTVARFDDNAGDSNFKMHGTIQVTNNTTNFGCKMQYDATEECIKFTFN